MPILMLMMTCAHESSAAVITANLDHHRCVPGCLDGTFVCWAGVWPLPAVITEPVAACVHVRGHGSLAYDSIMMTLMTC